MAAKELAGIRFIVYNFYRLKKDEEEVAESKSIKRFGLSSRAILTRERRGKMKERKWSNWFFAGIGLSFLFLSAKAADKFVQSTWAARPVVIDASAEEWSDDALVSQESPAVDLALRNDAENLYILFIIRDNDFLSTLEATGMSIFIDPLGKKKKDQGLRFFRRRVSADEFIQILERRSQILSEEQKDEIKSKPSYILYDCEILDKKKSVPPESLLAEGVELPTFRYIKQGERSVFEFRIPLGRGGGPGKIQASGGGTFKLGFEWGGLTKEMQAARLARVVAASEKGAERETASESHARGGRTGDFSTGAASAGPSRSGPKKYSFWLDVKLASSVEPGKIVGSSAGRNTHPEHRER